MKSIFLVLWILLPIALTAQKDTTNQWTFSGFADFYYSYDFSNPYNHKKPDFIYNHKRHNEINANLIFAKATFSDKIIRANLALMTGNYAQYNLSAEPTLLQSIYEANIGVKISTNKNIWLDAGIFPSHIGFESAISADCWTLTRSLLAENSPYFETGIKGSYTSANEKLYISLLVLNGWQRITKPDYVQKPSLGMQITYKALPGLLLNYSNFFGSDKPDSLQNNRLFHNFYLQYEPTSKIGLIAGMDIGRDKYNISGGGTWFSPVIIARYAMHKKLKIALRGEYYNDINQVIISTGLDKGWRISGLSANLDYTIHPKVLWRIEGKRLSSKDNPFDNGKTVNYSLTTNLSIKI